MVRFVLLPSCGQRTVSFRLDAEQTEYLLALARRAISEGLGVAAPRTEPPARPVDHTSGVFVTIKISGSLRGCIGTMTSDRALTDLVPEMAKSSAFHDPRFPPLSREELESADIEISILSPLTPIIAPEEVVVGTHGILIRNAGRSGVLLPQVATEYGWSRTEFLEHTCRKAGLQKKAYLKENVELFVFSAILCAERDT